MIQLKSNEDLDIMRRAGKIVALCQKEMSAKLAPGVTTNDLDKLADAFIRDHGAKPSFKGFKGYPAATCISVNEMVVHGIPNDRPLEEGDIVSLDFGVFLEGFHADGAWTYTIGDISPENQKLLNVTKESLIQAIAKCKPGNTVQDISRAVQTYVERNGFHIVRELVGHGIGRTLHEEPSIPNFVSKDSNAKLRPGMTFCVEPMVNFGTPKVKTLDDQWTVVTADGKPAAHYEHTIAITDKGYEILTQAQ
ncbi:MAG: type I methionyl aminopeptidase [Fimbriimonadaceae bacterium]